MKTSSWFVYIIATDKGSLYTGITTDVSRRFQEHLTGKKGAKFFHTSSPLKILFQKEFPSRSEASKFEAYVKKLKRTEKLKLIEDNSNTWTL